MKHDSAAADFRLSLALVGVAAGALVVLAGATWFASH